MVDKKQDNQVATSDTTLMLPANTSLMARLSRKKFIPEKELELGNLVHKNLKTEGNSSGKFIEIILKEDLYINTTGRNKLRDCLCEMPALPQEKGNSVNNTYSIISSNLERNRRQPGGSAINEVFFEDSDNVWKPLRVLRARKIPNLVKLDVEEVKDFLLENQDILSELLKNNITTEDIVALAYRKEQLETFEALLYDPPYFSNYKDQFNLRGDESVWQHFFERNTWIFGYGLNYVFTSPIGDLKLEQVVQGHSFFQSGKRVDALLQTRGLISSLCFVEIKTHNTHLIEAESYRPSCYAVSRELAGAVSQIQKTVQKAINNIRTKLELVTRDGDPTGDVAYLYQPRSFIVVGKLDEFQTAQGTNEDKFGSFELFRQNINNPEIVTFDELYERAKFIIRRAEI